MLLLKSSMRFATLLIFLLSPAALAAAPCVEFDKQEYCLKWASVDGTITNEYLRAGETVDAWARMITFKEFAGTNELNNCPPTPGA